MLKLENSSNVLIGKPKVGKSSFLATFPDVHFIDTENGLKHLNVSSALVRSWEEFIQEIDRIEAMPKKPAFIAIDTMTSLWVMLEESFCRNQKIEKRKIESMEELSFGKGTKTCSDMLVKQFRRINMWNNSIWLICHEKEFRKPKDKESMMTIADLPNPAWDKISGYVDSIMHVNVRNVVENGGVVKKHELILRGDEFLAAGCRLANAPDRCELNYEILKEIYEKG